MSDAAVPIAPAPQTLASHDASAAADPIHAPRLRECPDCGLLQRLPALPAKAVAHCPRCDAVLRRRRSDPVGRPLAFAVSGLAMLAVAADSPFIDLTVQGTIRQTTLVTGPEELTSQGDVALAFVVLLTTLLAPALRVAGLIWVLLGLRADPAPAYLATIFRWTVKLRPWAMIEVFLLGVFVAYTRLVDLARVEIGPALYAMAGVMLATAAADAALDPEAVWHRLDRRASEALTTRMPPGPVIGCDVCGLVTTADHATCDRCGNLLHRRKPHSIARTWALLISAAILYIPANALPVLTLQRFGQGAPSTILGGARELLDAGMWPLALLVFFASITVPVLKLASLSLMLVTTQRRSGWRLHERTRLYRIVDFIGRWSMIDVFMISILTALVRLGRVAVVFPGPGVLAFCSVVILTMFAAATFDPRLMWDATGANARLARRTTQVAAPARAA